MTCNIDIKEIVQPRALKAPFTRSLYPGANEIESIVEMNSQTGNYETRVMYKCNTFKDKKAVYAFVGKYIVEPINDNKQIRLTEYE